MSVVFDVEYGQYNSVTKEMEPLTTTWIMLRKNPTLKEITEWLYDQTKAFNDDVTKVNRVRMLTDLPAKRRH